MDNRLQSFNTRNVAVNKLLLSFLALVLLLIFSAITNAADLKPRFIPQKKVLSKLNQAQANDKLIVKFIEGSGVRLKNNNWVAQKGTNLGQARKILRIYGIPSGAIKRLHSVPEKKLDEMKQKGQKNTGRQLADLNLYYEISIPQNVDIIDVINNLNRLEIVEFSEPAPKPLPLPVDIPPTTPDFRPNQTYKGPAPDGINTVDEINFPGANGTNMQIVDVEYSWLFDHEDLNLPPTANIDTQPAIDPFNNTEHGTAVLGEIGGNENVYGVTGISPDSTMLVAPANTTLGYNPARAITLATAALNPGDVILLEQQYPACSTGNYGPIEVIQSVFDAISVASANNIIVVEAAGNGNVNLDDPNCNSLFDRNFRDSGAIIVGAGVPGTRMKYGYSTYGSRVDVQGWGGEVTTTGYGSAFNPGGDKRQFYTYSFSGTSSASPIVSGAVLSIQGALKGAGMTAFTPQQMRDLLVATGTPQPTADEENWHIGPLPNILGALNNVLTNDSLFENFNDGNYVGWSIVDEGTIRAPSGWTAASGEMIQTSAIYSNPTDASPEKLGTYALYDGGFGWTDYRATLMMRSDDNEATGFMFRIVDSDNYYRFSWDRGRSYRRLVKRVAGVTSVLQEDAVPYVSGQTYHIEVTALGNQLQVRIDGELIFDVIDSSHNMGSIALYTWANVSSFDDIKVINLAAGNIPPVIHNTSATPSSILDTETSLLMVNASDLDNSPSPLSFNWIVPPGQGSVDNPGSSTPIFTPADVSADQDIINTVEVSDGDITVSETVTISIQDAAAPPSLLSEDFNDGDYNQWSIVDEGTIRAPSGWTAASGDMLQTSAIYSEPTDASPEKLGTYAVYNGGSGWTDYRATFTMRSDNTEAIGFMFRVVDSDNYYRFSWDRNLSYRRLVKRVAGVTSIVQEDAVPYVSGQTYQVEITALGNQLQVRIDGVLIFDVTDTTHNAGSIALYTWANVSSFDNIRVDSL